MKIEIIFMTLLFNTSDRHWIIFEIYLSYISPFFSLAINEYELNYGNNIIK